METEYETEIDDSRGIIYLHGDLDNETAGEALRRAFNKVFDRGLRTVILDMSDVDIINSFGIGKILVCQKRMTA
ncbi:MAG: STAS domain-containing protein, partial [Bdellovibrionales bacterium]|nr:STAS domain-containing protein [Bdellovibrionales bacterium]